MADSVHFAIYSTDNTDPDLASDCTWFYQDPTHGEYDPEHGWEGRGSHLPTLSGVFHQDFGVDVKDCKILIRDDNALTQPIKDALQAKYQAKGKQWHFTDGVNVFLVIFSRSPRGFRAWCNMRMWGLGLQVSQPPPDRYVRYSYEILLHIVEVVQ